MLNKMIIIGNVGRDAELHYTANGNAVADFSVAVNNLYSGSAQSKEEPEWFKVTAWNKLAETVHEHVVKGMKVYVEGRIKLEKWKGTDGIERSQNNITAQQITFISRPEQGVNAQQGGYAGAAERTPQPVSGQPVNRPRQQVQHQPAPSARRQVGSQQRPVQHNTQHSQPAGAVSRGTSRGLFGEDEPPW